MITFLVWRVLRGRYLRLVKALNMLEVTTEKISK